MATVNTVQPTVYLMLAGSAIAFDDTGEIVETVEFDEKGQPLWQHAGVCDDRGIGGPDGYDLIRTALRSAEANAMHLDGALVHVASEFLRGA